MDIELSGLDLSGLAPPSSPRLFPCARELDGMSNEESSQSQGIAEVDDEPFPYCPEQELLALEILERGNVPSSLPPLDSLPIPNGKIDPSCTNTTLESTNMRYETGKRSSSICDRCEHCLLGGNSGERGILLDPGRYQGLRVLGYCTWQVHQDVKYLCEQLSIPKLPRDAIVIAGFVDDPQLGWGADPDATELLCHPAVTPVNDDLCRLFHTVSVPDGKGPDGKVKMKEEIVMRDPVARLIFSLPGRVLVAINHILDAVPSGCLPPSAETAVLTQK